jgi:hypothetical protein
MQITHTRSHTFWCKSRTLDHIHSDANHAHSITYILMQITHTRSHTFWCKPHTLDHIHSDANHIHSITYILMQTIYTRSHTFWCKPHTLDHVHSDAIMHTRSRTFWCKPHTLDHIHSDVNHANSITYILMQTTHVPRALHAPYYLSQAFPTTSVASLRMLDTNICGCFIRVYHTLYMSNFNKQNVDNQFFFIN